MKILVRRDGLFVSGECYLEEVEIEIIWNVFFSVQLFILDDSYPGLHILSRG